VLLAAADECPIFFWCAPVRSVMSPSTPAVRTYVARCTRHDATSPIWRTEGGRDFLPRHGEADESDHAQGQRPPTRVLFTWFWFGVLCLGLIMSRRSELSYDELCFVYGTLRSRLDSSARRTGGEQGQPVLFSTCCSADWPMHVAPPSCHVKLILLFLAACLLV
jgi:hypothetical protein